MRFLLGFLALVWLPAVVLGEEKVVVPEGWDMEIGAVMDGGKERGRKNEIVVAVVAVREGGKVEARVEGVCYGAGDGMLDLDGEMLRVFYKVCQLADGEEEHVETVTRKVYGEEVVTRFSGHKGFVRIDGSEALGPVVANLPAIREEAVKDAELAARAAEAWYRALLAKGVRPEETAGRRRPVTLDSYVKSEVGGLEVGRFRFVLGGLGSRVAGYKVEYDLYVEKEDGSSSWFSGVRVEALLEEMYKAVDARREGKVYSVKGEGLGFEVVADPKVDKVRVSVRGDDSFEEGEVSADFSVKEIEHLRSLRKEAGKRAEWLRENEGLFFRREEE